MHGERHGWRVESVIDESLGNIFFADSCIFFYRCYVDDELMRASLILCNAGDLVVRLQFSHEIVSIENSIGSCFANTLLPQHRYVAIRNSEDRG